MEYVFEYSDEGLLDAYIRSVSYNEHGAPLKSDFPDHELRKEILDRMRYADGRQD